MRALLVVLAFFTTVPADYVARLDSGSAPVLASARLGTLGQATRKFGKPDLVQPLRGRNAACLVT